MSYANVLLYSAALPAYDDKKEEEIPIDADDPRNQELINKELFG